MPPRGSAPGKPGKRGERSRPDFVGWSGVQPIATLIETIIGIETNTPANQIHWTLRMTEAHGVKQLKWGENYHREVDLLAAARESEASAVSLQVTTNTPFTLVVDTGFSRTELAVGAGPNQTFQIPVGESGEISKN